MLSKKLQSATAAKQYVDDVFSTYLYTGNGSTQTINNGIDLAGEGGLVWIKARPAENPHMLFDTARGAPNYLRTNTTDPATNGNADTLVAFRDSGFSLGEDVVMYAVNHNGRNYASWAFRKATKFFDIVTYTGNGVAGRQIAHRLGIAPGMVISKSTNTISDWNVYHRSATGDLKLNLTNAQTGSRTIITAANDTTFTVSGAANTNGVSYVAYLFAHDPSEDGIIQCGSYVGNGTSTTVNLGWEPQWLLVKRIVDVGFNNDWRITDSMRGVSTGGGEARLLANSTGTESFVVMSTAGSGFNATGFTQTGSTDTSSNVSASTYIYLAIRRPNKPPKTGTEVYNAFRRVGTASNAKVTGVGFAPDFALSNLSALECYGALFDRLRGGTKQLRTNQTEAESTQSVSITSLDQDGYTVGIDNVTNSTNGNTSSPGYINHFFRRAPGFFDVVCYTGDGGVARTVNHNLGVAPELMILKARGTDTGQTNGFWPVYTSAGNGFLNDNGSFSASNITNLTASTFGQIQFGSAQYGNTNAVPFVAYLFASLPGISKVGSYTGNGGSQTIDCGFTTGARFILIKRTDDTGDWYVWDSARGIVSANDPHLSLNTTAAEVTTDDSVDPDNSGFIVNQVVATNINVNGASYIYLAIS